MWCYVNSLVFGCCVKCLVIQFKAVKIKLSSCFAIAFHSTLCYIGLFLLISVPPSPHLLVEDLPFFLPLKNSIKLHSPLKTSIIYGSTHEEYGFIPEEFREKVSFPCLPWRFCWILKLYLQRIPYFFNFTPKEILNLLTCPGRIPPVLNQWWGVGCRYYLTIIPRTWMGSELIAHEAEGQMGYWLRGHEGERNNCFSKIQLVGQKYRK